MGADTGWCVRALGPTQGGERTRGAKREKHERIEIERMRKWDWNLQTNRNSGAGLLLLPFVFEQIFGLRQAGIGGGCGGGGW